MPQRLVDLPPELTLHIIEYVMVEDSRLIRLESNIKNLCNFELISKQLKLGQFLEKYWKIVLYQFIHIRLENGKEVSQSWLVWKNIDGVFKEFVKRKRSYKRCFAIVNEVERRNYWNTDKSKFKMCITGPGGSGIHSFIYRVMSDVYCEEYDYPIDEVFYKTIPFNDRKVELEIWESGFRNDYYIFLECKF